MIERSDLVYTGGWKYRTKKLFCISTTLRPDRRYVIPGYVILDTDGDLYILPNYCWDGPSGPTYDYKSDMAGSLVHDALCQLLTEGGLPLSYKPEVDRMLKLIMIEDGACKLRAVIYEKAVNKFGGNYLKPKKIYVVAA